MRITVCELPDDSSAFADRWRELRAHVETERSDLVLLPEMPFAPWVSATPADDEGEWEEAVRAHDEWMDRLPELAPAAVLGSRPTTVDGRRLNEGFVWTEATGTRLVHQKSHLPDGQWFWEASWYEAGDGDFSVFECAGASCGFLICTELWAAEQAREYGQDGVQLILNPRVTETFATGQWRAGARTMSTLSGAFLVSSNRTANPQVNVTDAPFGGGGWIVDPDGTVLAETSRAQPITTLRVDLDKADEAKRTYPRYVFDQPTE